ncbi:MAG: OmpA family protein, partial [Nevskiaceae bacterium]
FNRRLSVQRAETVKAYLAERGVSADRISVVGYGEAQPRDTNDTIEGRRLNRRVEIRAIGG